jgi:hypothetical protein
MGGFALLGLSNWFHFARDSHSSAAKVFERKQTPFDPNSA